MKSIMRGELALENIICLRSVLNFLFLFPSVQGFIVRPRSPPRAGDLIEFQLNCLCHKMRILRECTISAATNAYF